MRILLCFIFGLLISSCSSFEYLSIDALIPAKHSLQPEIKSVVIVNNSMPFRGKELDKAIINGVTHDLDTVWYDDFAINVVKSLKEELLARNFFDTVYVEQSGNYPSGNEMTPYDIEKIANMYNSEAVITLQSYFYRNWYEVNQYDTGTIGSLDVSSGILWSLHNNLTHKMQIEDIEKDTISWTEEGATIEHVAEKLPGIRTGLEELSYYVGGKSADLFAPYWERQSRGIYTNGNYSFMQAAEYVRHDNWEEAMKLWKIVFENSKKKIKARAAFNLALGSEVKGDFDGAHAWIKECYDILKYLPANNRNQQDLLRMKAYFTEIVKRTTQAKKLQIQVGGDL